MTASTNADKKEGEVRGPPIKTNNVQRKSVARTRKREAKDIWNQMKEKGKIINLSPAEQVRGKRLGLEERGRKKGHGKRTQFN